MANPVPAGSDVSAGTYQCTNCGNEIVMRSQTHIPPCPQCHDTVIGRRSAAETAFMTRIPTATPRDAPSVDCLGMGQAQGLVFLVTSASGRNRP
jgi:predicted RNA-binding Zn-ribbon protein involved in translation (DUF1610 family)